MCKKEALDFVYGWGLALFTRNRRIIVSENAKKCLFSAKCTEIFLVLLLKAVQFKV